MGTRSAGAVAPECGSGSGPGRSSRGRRGAGGQGVALSRSELGPVRGPGCPASRVRGKRAPRRGVPGRGTSLLRTGPHPDSAQGRSSDLRSVSWELGATPSPPAPSTLGFHTPLWLLCPAPPPLAVRAHACVCVRARAREAGKGAEVQRLLLASPLPLPPPGYQWGVPRLSAWPGRLQTRPGDSGR